MVVARQRTVVANQRMVVRGRGVAFPNQRMAILKLAQSEETLVEGVAIFRMNLMNDVTCLTKLGMALVTFEACLC